MAFFSIALETYFVVKFVSRLLKEIAKRGCLRQILNRSRRDALFTKSARLIRECVRRGTPSSDGCICGGMPVGEAGIYGGAPIADEGVYTGG
jgi:hypothetical protein